ncbi:EF-hand domain-containing protein [Pseudoluteimonas lycopersici]|uniref:EF-hand domain-containing protein n=1 Tax=Pseudoluteimonas lycopersici TaxID=1324796 RepID=A0A516V1Z2_9GAMM|nr:EF-hand domain-containing protein [Lysobacter lycopersici]QDQ72549.1 EF-hand domain-containing protein [Lysobacter lycopersici]
MPHPRALLALAFAAVLASTAACAQQAATPSTSTDAPRQRLDANGDGMIDKSEAAKAPRLAQKFDQLDTNHDGRLTADELPHGQRGDRGGRDGNDGSGGGMHERMMQLDTDHDGRISSKEAAAKPELAQRFAQMDSNHDGFLDRSDFEARRQQKRDECFANADADKDGKLSRSEYDSAHQQCQSHGGMRGPRGGGDTPTPPPAG